MDGEVKIVTEEMTVMLIKGTLFKTDDVIFINSEYAEVLSAKY
ncbi:MAG: hypothetical protein ACJAVV_003838 [Alphaproteobacteria bacterium]